MDALQKKTNLVIVLGIGLCLGGCLTKESSDTPDNGPAPPGPTNSAPTISGSPPSAVAVGQSFTFTPSASDPDGDPLTFSVQNLPSWASFNTSSGRVDGSPTLADVGNYANISISVSDGTNTSGLSAFAVDVVQMAAQSTTLSWSAPTMNDDGTPLTDLTGYVIHYGTSSGNYTNQIQVNNPSVLTYVVENLSPTTYYFAATAVNSAGVQSAFSGEAVRNLSN